MQQPQPQPTTDQTPSPPLDVDDNHSDGGGDDDGIQRFSFAHMNDALSVLNNEDACRQLPSTPLLQVCREITKLTTLLGPALYFAAKDINAKLSIIEHHLTEVSRRTGQAPHPSLGFPLRLLMLGEIESGTTTTTNIPSLCRTFARVVWFLQFTTTLLTILTDESAAATALSMQQIASRAYESALAPHHKPFVRAAVQVALFTACPSRLTCIKRLVPSSPEGDASAPSTIASLRCFTSALRAPLVTMHAFSNAHSLSTLP